MSTHLPTSLLAITLLVASINPAYAYVGANDNVESVSETTARGYRRVADTSRYKYTKRALDSANYYGIPRSGVELLRTDRRMRLLQELEQREANLAKIRKPGPSRIQSHEQRLQERILRRVGNRGVTHYRAPEEAPYRLVWDGNKLVKAPILTPDGVEAIVDEFESDRALRMSSDDCREFSGRRAASCRYQRRVQERIYQQEGQEK